VSTQKSDPHPIVATDPAGNTIDVTTSAPTAGMVGLVVRPIPSSTVTQTQDAADGPTNTTAPADAIQIGGQDGSGNLQALQVDPSKQLKVSNIGVTLHSYGQASVGTSPALVIAANTSRAALLLKNPASNTAVIWVGDAAVATGNGFPLEPGTSVGWPATSVLWAVAAAAAQTLAYAEFQ
jgi:hypothetical protein